MNKINYIIPYMEVVKVQTQQMLAASVETGIYSGGEPEAPGLPEPDTNMFGF